MLENVYCLSVGDIVVKTFNKYNRWVEVTDKESLVPENFINSGFNYNILNSVFNYIYLRYTEVPNDLGKTVLESEELDSSWGIEAIEEVDLDGETVLKVTIPQYTVKDSIRGEKIYFYSEDVEFKPTVLGVTFTPSSTHKEGIIVNCTYAYNFNENIKWRIKVNETDFSDWSPLMSATEDIVGNIFIDQLTLGTNKVTLEISNEDETKVTEYIVEDAVQLVNELPGIYFITAESDELKLSYRVDDENLDNIKRKIEIVNSEYPDGYTLIDWNKPKKVPFNEVVYIDTKFIVPDVENILKITVNDGFEDTISEYKFTGTYRNLLFIDDTGEYLSTDEGVILKILNFEYIVSGAQSDVKTVTLKNNNDYPVYHIRLGIIDKSELSGITPEISKSSNPFKSSDYLDYGDIVLQPGETMDFYVRIDTNVKAEGILNFDIEVNSDKYEENSIDVASMK